MNPIPNNNNNLDLNFKTIPLISAMKNNDNIINEKNKIIIKNEETNLAEINENEENLLE